MKVDYLEEGSSLRHLDIELPPSDLEDEFEKGVGRLSRTLKLPGFRKGKIPKDIIRSRFRSDVLSQAVQDLVPNALGQALKERSLYPLDDPRISKLESELGKPLRFRASFEVIPNIEARDYRGLEVEEPKTAVTDEQVDKGVEGLREQHARFDPIEGRGARDGDFVMGDLEERSADGKPQKHEGVNIEVGSDSYHRGLHEGLQGAKPGDVVRFTASFPADHGSRARAGKTFEGDFLVHELKEKVLPAADDELAKDLGDYETLAELRAGLRQRAEERAAHEDRQELRRRLLAKLVEVNPFDPPASLVELELDSRIEAAGRDLYQRGVDPNAAGIDWGAVRKNEKASADTAVRATLLLEKIAEQEGLSVSEEEVSAELGRYAEALEKSKEALRAQMTKDGSLERLKGRLRREKAVDFITLHAKLK